jgi:hypothetical protein
MEKKDRFDELFMVMIIIVDAMIMEMLMCSCAIKMPLVTASHLLSAPHGASFQRGSFQCGGCECLTFVHRWACSCTVQGAQGKNGTGDSFYSVFTEFLF